MMHVKQIRQVIEEGRSNEAEDAIEQLLALGPHNTEALKLKAMLYGQKGRFAEEGKTWERVISIDNEDPDAINYFRLRHLEDREHFYFTDDLPNGGRRFIAYPKSLVRSTFLALCGCMGFLALTRLTLIFPEIESPEVLLPLFFALVIGPWLWTVLSWLRAIRHISITRDRIEFATRLKTQWLEWTAIDGVYLAHGASADGDSLALVLIPKNKEQAVVQIDLSTESSAIRARPYLIKEIAVHFREPALSAYGDLAIGSRPLLKF